MYSLRNLAVRFSLGSLALATTVVACSDLPTTPVAPMRPSLATNTASGIPTGKTVVIFKDTAAIPAAGLNLLSSLGGTVTTKWDGIGVAIVTGLSVQSLATLRANSLVEDVGNDRIQNWLPRLKIGPAVDAGVGALPQGDPSQARYYVDGTQWSA
jgi:hypothetical protein